MILLRTSGMAAGIFLILGAGAACAAPSSRDGAFLKKKRDVIAVVIERTRQAPDDAQRALKAGQDNLRRLHEDYQVSRSTPPTTLNGDVRELVAAAARVRLASARGQTLPADPRAETRIGALWEEYRARMEILEQGLQEKRDAGASEEGLYWDALKEQESLATAVVQDAAYNPPPGERSAEEAADKDRWELLKRLEDPARVRGRLGCVKAPEEIARAGTFDVSPFYHAAGLLPGTNPLRKTSFEIPPGCRTVVQRENNDKLILRAVDGRGTVFLGQTAIPLAYEYVTVPPDVPYIVENPGDKPLDVEYIALEPSPGGP